MSVRRLRRRLLLALERDQKLWQGIVLALNPAICPRLRWLTKTRTLTVNPALLHPCRRVNGLWRIQSNLNYIEQLVSRSDAIDITHPFIIMIPWLLEYFTRCLVGNHPYLRSLLHHAISCSQGFHHAMSCSQGFPSLYIYLLDNF